MKGVPGEVISAMIAAGTAASLLLAVSGCGAELRPAASTRSSIAPDGGLARAAVDDAIRTHVPALRACYEKFAAAEGRPMGVVRFGWRIDPSGAVSSVVIVATTLHSAAIEGCVADEVARWRFPAAARETEVTEHPFSF